MEVNVTTDGPGSGPGQLDLRQAISLANVAPGKNTVSFDPSVFGTTPQTITLTQGQIGLGAAGSPTVAGPGARLLTINGNNATRLFLVKGTTATLSGMTITGGHAYYGGGVANYSGTLSMTGCVIAGNTAYLPPGDATGGGLFNTGNSTLTNCTISGNRSNSSGAGLDNQGTLSLTNCTVVGNYSYQGGGIANGGALAMTNCTVSGNTTVDHRQSGGIFNYGSMSMVNTIVSFNLNGDIYGGFSGSNNLVGPNPLVLPLGDYGGPVPTMALIPGSPAIGGGTTGPGVPATDQREGFRGGPRSTSARASFKALWS